MWKSIACGMLGAAVPLASLSALALAKEAEEDRIIQVAPDRDATVSPEQAEVAPKPVPSYWIGLMGGPVTDELRAHLELPANRGILVREVVPESPAERAGIQQYDILLRAGDEELGGMQDLVKHVVKAGESEGHLKLELIRHGRQEVTEVTPEKRPERIAGIGAPGAGGMNPFNVPLPEGFGGEGGGIQFRNLGPDVFIGQPFAGQQVPNGVAITMKREGDKPAEITVKRGDESWTVIADDPKSIEQLPEDLRPLVANMLQGNRMFPGGRLGFPAPELMQPFGGNLQERLEAMERQMRELEEQFRNREEN